MPKFFDNGENGPAQLTGLSSGSWSTDVDLDSDASYVGSAPTIPATATGVIIRVVNTATTGREFGARHPDSATARINDIIGLTGGSQVDAYVGINSSHEIDIYTENANLNIYILGYFEAETTFFSDANQDTFNPTSTSTWHTIDKSAVLSSGCVFAILEITHTNYTDGLNFQHPDSSDNRTRGSLIHRTIAQEDIWYRITGGRLCLLIRHEILSYGQRQQL
jgi:hypothetical protein